ncbi:MAG: endonuclease domain-containing protein [Candidatus Sericytochromatia bacterium]
MRNAATEAEAALWQALKGKGLMGWKFRRQHGMGVYIVDFYCPAARLVIEVDGGYHLAPAQRLKDAAREAYISARNIRFLRFSNQQVLEELPAVLETIALALTTPVGSNCEGATIPPSSDEEGQVEPT